MLFAILPTFSILKLLKAILSEYVYLNWLKIFEMLECTKKNASIIESCCWPSRDNTLAFSV